MLVKLHHFLLRVVVGAFVANFFVCFSIQAAQDDLGPVVEESSIHSNSESSRAEWLQRVREAKQRVKEAARERREHPERHLPIPQNSEIVASERVLNDDSLQPGDIVVTKNGMFFYYGRSDQPRSEDDFVPIGPGAMR
jgi:hypothetical protein